MGIKSSDRLFIALEKSLQSQAAFGESKREAKANKATTYKIYSFKTMKTYTSDCRTFATWAYENYKCKSMEQALPHVEEFCTREGLAPHTQQKYLCSLSKAYKIPLGKTLGIKTMSRQRTLVTRSRGPHGAKARDRSFSETKNAELVEFCKHTGLRRHELQMLEGRDLVMRDGKAYIHVRNGKGGKERYVPVLNNNPAVIERMRASNGLVWGKVNAHADIHAYRRDYANAWYQQLARDVDKLDRKDRYDCRKDLAGLHFDRNAMLIVSKYLGHERIDVIAQSYLDW